MKFYGNQLARSRDINVLVSTGNRICTGNRLSKTPKLYLLEPDEHVNTNIFCFEIGTK